MKMNRGASLFVAIGTAAANWIIFYAVASRFGSTEPAFMATILLAAIVVHEIGHAIVLEANGVKTHMIFLVILGGVCTDKRYERVENKLHWNTQSLVYFAGVLGNLFVALIGVLLYAMDAITFKGFTQIVNLNAVLIFFNMFPIWITDGGRFAKIFFDSTPENQDKSWVFKIAVPILFASIFLTVVSPHAFPFTAIVMLWSLHYQAEHDDPKASTDRKALTPDQRKGWAVAYLSIFMISMIMLGFTPDWITGK